MDFLEIFFRFFDSCSGYFVGISHRFYEDLRGLSDGDVLENFFYGYADHYFRLF